MFPARLTIELNQLMLGKSSHTDPFSPHTLPLLSLIGPGSVLTFQIVPIANPLWFSILVLFFFIAVIIP